jgi:hypothetical protein
MPVIVSVPPCLADTASGRYAISGSTWIKVPDNTRFEDLDKYMVYERKSPESRSDGLHGVWAVVGSKGAHYTVRAQSGRYSCTCPGFGWRGKCKHIEQVKKENRDKS